MTLAHVYAHFPFCASKCPYCDFNSYAGREAEIDTYVEALLAEARLRLPGTGVETIYVGGGTPTHCEADTLESYLTGLREAAGGEPLEFTVEANPGTLDGAKAAALRRAGVNRVSLGAQSFHARHREKLGRVHDVRAIGRSVDVIREAGIQHVSLDLILALPGQSLAEQARDVSRTLALTPEHVSAYVLTIEGRTPFARMVAEGLLPAPDGDRELSHLRLARAHLEEAGLERYEVSNFSRPGRACRHNLAYWRDSDWVGLGAGAHSHVEGRRSKNVDEPTLYASQMRAGRDVVSWVETAPPEVSCFEALLMGLRLVEGVDLEAIGARTGVDVQTAYAQALTHLEGEGLLEQGGGRLRATPRGFELLSWVLGHFVPDERAVVERRVEEQA